MPSSSTTPGSTRRHWGFRARQAALVQFVAGWTDSGALLSKAVSEIQKGLSNAASNYGKAEKANVIHYTPAYH